MVTNNEHSGKVIISDDESVCLSVAICATSYLFHCAAGAKQPLEMKCAGCGCNHCGACKTIYCYGLISNEPRELTTPR